MISILKHPYVCSFTQNNMLFKVESDMRYESQKVVGSMVLAWSNKGVLGNYLSFQFVNPETEEDVFIKITCVRDLVNVGDIPESVIFAGTLAEYTLAVYDILREISILNAFYYITKSGNTITITPKEALEELVFTNYSISGTFASQLTVTNKAGYVNPQERDGYEMFASVYVESSFEAGDFAFVGNLNVALNENSIGQVNVARIVHGAIESSWQEIPLPDLSLNHYLADNGRRYYVEFTERWSGESTPLKKVSQVLYAHWGGQSVDNANINEPLSRIATNMSFLTQQPSGKIIHDNQRDWLSWMNTGTDESITAKITVVWFEGGTDDQATSTMFTTTVKQWQTICIQTSPLFLDLYNLCGQFPCKSFTIEIFKTGTSTPLSQKYVYHIDQVCSEMKNLLFFNGYGLPETIFSTGPWIQTFNSSKDIAVRSRQFNQSNLRPSNFVFNKESQNSVKASTQVFPKNVALRLQDMLNTTIAYLFEVGQVRPIIISSAAAEVEEQHIYTMRLPLDIVMANATKEVSFEEDHPKLVMSDNQESEYYFTVDPNHFQITTYGALNVLLDGVAQSTLAWNSGTMQYATLTGVLNGNFYVFCDVTDSTGVVHRLGHHFYHKRNEIAFETTKNGAWSMNFERASGTSELQIDFGDGQGTYAFSLGTNTNVPYTYANAFLKHVSVFKSSFADITGWVFTNVQVRNFELYKLPNLLKLHLINCDPGSKLYLMNLPKMVNLQITSAAVNEIELDYMPNLTNMTLSGLNLTSAGLENIIATLWKFRKLMTTAPTIFITGNLPTITANVTAMIQGTGVYLDEGLAADYGWTVTIS